MNLQEFWQHMHDPKVQLIFLCAGNICRSPYAAYMFKKMLENSKINRKNKFIVQSGGFIKQRDTKIHPFTARALKEEGFSAAAIDQHYPRTMRKHKDDLQNATALIVMTHDHKHILMPKKYREKTFLLASLGYSAIDDDFQESTNHNEALDILDPALIQDYTKYLEIMSTIKQYLENILRKLETMGI